MQLHFQTYGSGRPLLILHGLFGSLDNWQGISRRLASNFQVFGIDLRNHGRSPHSTEMDIPVMADDVFELSQQQQLADIFLLGHSLGGKVAMELALRHPALVKKLVVVDIPPGVTAPRHTAMLHAMGGLDLQTFTTRAQMEEALEPAIPERVVRQFLLKSVERGENGKFRWRLNLEEIQRNYPKLNEEIPDGRRYENPVLFIRASDSDYMTGADLTRIKELFPRGQMVVIPGAGHWVHAEAPELFTSIVLKFLQGPV